MKRLLLIAALLLFSGLALAQTCPVQTASDNFTRANGTLGGNWTVVGGTWAISFNTAIVTGGAGKPTPVYWSSNTLVSAQCAGFKMAYWTALSRAGAGIYMATAAYNGYYVYCSGASSGNCTSV